MNEQLKDKATLILANQGQEYKGYGHSITFKLTSEISNNQLGIYNIVLSANTIGAPLHYHKYIDETFIVNKGILTVRTSENEYLLTPGSMVHVPRLTPHSFRNYTDECVELTLIFNPSNGREGFFVGLHQILNEEIINNEEFIKLYKEYDSYPL